MVSILVQIYHVLESCVVVLFIATEQGDILRVDAKPEKLMQVTTNNSFDLLKAAYHLENRHVPHVNTYCIVL